MRVNDIILYEAEGEHSLAFADVEYTNFQPLNHSLTNMGIYYVDFSVNRLRQPANHHHGCLLLVIDLEKVIG